MVLLNEFKMNSRKDVEDTRVHIISHLYKKYSMLYKKYSMLYKSIVCYIKKYSMLYKKYIEEC